MAANEIRIHVLNDQININTDIEVTANSMPSFWTVSIVIPEHFLLKTNDVMSSILIMDKWRHVFYLNHDENKDYLTVYTVSPTSILLRWEIISVTYTHVCA